jgi:hypothetical protein
LGHSYLGMGTLKPRNNRLNMSANDKELVPKKRGKRSRVENNEEDKMESTPGKGNSKIAKEEVALDNNGDLISPKDVP